jgi:hypothetical protein
MLNDVFAAIGKFIVAAGGLLLHLDSSSSSARNGLTPSSKSALLALGTNNRKRLNGSDLELIP